MSLFLTLIFFHLIRWIQLCEKKNLTFVDCCDEFCIKLVLQNFIKLAEGSLYNIFQDLFSKILSQPLTHDRPYISAPLSQMGCNVRDTLYQAGHHIQIYESINFTLSDKRLSHKVNCFTTRFVIKKPNCNKLSQNAIPYINLVQTRFVMKIT